jgi:hypothetical protein
MLPYCAAWIFPARRGIDGVDIYHSLAVQRISPLQKLLSVYSDLRDAGRMAQPLLIPKTKPGTNNSMEYDFSKEVSSW